MGQVYSHISEEERQVIQIEVGNGTPIRAMAAMPGRSPSSVSREIKRNTWFPSNQNESYRPYRPARLKTGPWTGGYYLAPPAQRKAMRRSRLARRPVRMANDALCVWVEERLAGYLHHAHRGRRKHAGRRVHGSPIGMRVALKYRTAPANSRAGFGHGEADSVIGVGRRLHTEVERKTRYLKATLIADKGSAATLKAQWAMFASLPSAARRSVAHDNGSEFAAHHVLVESLGMPAYFADPYSSWRRGSNENRNSIIRRHLPKGTPITPDMAAEPQAILDETDNRPMRVLGYRTPAEAFMDELLQLPPQ